MGLRVHDPDAVGNSLRGGAIVANLTLSGDDGGVVGKVELRGPDVSPGGAEQGIDWQRLMDGRHDVQPYVLVDAAIVGVKVGVVPVERGSCGDLFVLPVVVGADGEHVFSGIGDDGVGDVEAEDGDPVFVAPKKLAVQIDLTSHADAFELEKDALTFGVCGDAEMFAVPGDAGGHIVDADLVGRVLIPGVRKRDALPFGVIERGRPCVDTIANTHEPTLVEVVTGPRGGRLRGSGSRVGSCNCSD